MEELSVAKLREVSQMTDGDKCRYLWKLQAA